MKTVLITGISKGIGAALSSEFLSAGWLVFGTYYGISPKSQENLEILPLDLSAPSSISECVAELTKRDKKISVLINNAGVLIDREETSVVISKLRATLEINLIGLIDFTERILPLVENNGHIINISSTAGSLELADDPVSHAPGFYPSYRISKSALNMYTRTLAGRKEIKDKGIVVSSVHPGWVKTDMGGLEAPISPQEAARDIFKFSLSHPESGYFWFKGEKLPW